MVQKVASGRSGTRCTDESLLRERHLHAVAGASRLHRDDGRTRLFDEGPHDAVDRASGDARHLAPEVLAGGVREGVRLEVGGDAFSEGLRADVGLDHPQHAGRLLVRDAVEDLVDLVGRLDVDPDRPRRSQRIESQRALRIRAHRRARHSSPGRHAASGRLAIQVANPSLSQMSFHHFIVTRLPNHWCAISCEMIDATLLRASSDARVGIDEQQPLAEGDRARVLHRAGREVRHRDDVELAERVLDAEVVVVEGELLFRCLERDTP